MGEAFAVYATPAGYVAVTNPVRQRILRALEDGERTLGDLVKLTGKAKSTVSAVHLRDLQARGLVEQRADAADARVKWYRLAARRIGSSSVPIQDLREAVRDYAASTRGGMALPVGEVFGAFDQLPLLRPEESRWVALVGERLGSLAAARLKANEPAALLRELGGAWRREGLGPVARVRADASAIELRHAPGARPGGPRCALAAGFLQGALTTRAGRPAWVREEACAGRDRAARCRFAVTWPPGRGR